MQAAGGRSVEEPLEALLGEDAPLCGLLRARNVRCVGDLLYLPPWELRDWLLVSEEEATSLVARAWMACASPLLSAWDLLSRSVTCRATVRVPLPSLESAFGAAGLSGAFVEVAGPAGVGKTQCCLHLAALTAIEGGQVFWLDTEQTFSPARAFELLRGLSHGADEDGGGGDDALALAALRRVRQRSCSSLREVHEVAAELAERAAQGGELPALLVVDSIAAVARTEGSAAAMMAGGRSSIPQRQRALSALAGVLKVIVGAVSTAEDCLGTAVVVTNQVAGDPSAAGGGSKVALGHVWHHAVNWRLVLSHLPPDELQGLGSKECGSCDGSRFLLVEKSPVAARAVVRFAIGAEGLREVAASPAERAASPRVGRRTSAYA